MAADALYILGDLFDSWVGDDDNSELAGQVREGLKALSAQTKIYFQPGNRDFLIGGLFAHQTGIRMMEAETVIEINKQRILLMHGDLLCTDDVDYQQARITLRSKEFISDFLTKSLKERARLAAQYRKLSGEATAAKASDIMDVNQQTVLSFMRRHKAHYLIHGHTHRPGEHSFELDGQPCQRLVLAAWQDKAAQIMRLDYSADKPGMLISRYEEGTENSSAATS
jgi:UDP-2,3-diacylglucosamine hydrolase